MNTEIYLWVEPLIMDHQRCSERVHFNCTIPGKHKDKSTDELESLLEGRTMDDIMTFANIDSNWNYGVISARLTNYKVSIEFADSPEDRAINDEIIEIVSEEKELIISDNNLEIADGGIINLSIPHLKIQDKIDFTKIWDSIEKQIIGKIKKGDTIIITDDSGNKVLEVLGGSYLNVGLADLKVYDTKKMAKVRSIMNDMQGQKGGLFLRENGDLCIGDLKRTFYMRIYTENLLKASLKIGKPIFELLNQKLLNHNQEK